jgi:hypothetical protein
MTNRLHGYLVGQDARDFKRSDAMKNGKARRYEQVGIEDTRYIQKLCKQYPKVWSNREAEGIMIEMEDELSRFGLYGPNNEGSCKLTVDLYEARHARKPARMTKKRAELLKGLCISYIHEKDSYKFSEISERLEKWLDRFEFADSAFVIAREFPLKGSLMDRLNKYRKIYARAKNPDLKVLYESIERILDGGRKDEQ